MFMIILIGIGLSMDAFSLSLIYGIRGINRREGYLLAVIVGLFHFFMPLLGLLFGRVVFSCYEFNFSVLASIIFGLIGIDMIISGIRNRDVDLVSSFIGYIMFGFSVSIDSFTTGIGIYSFGVNYLIVSFVFMLCSGFFTYFGVRFGNILGRKIGKYSNCFGGVIFLLICIYYFVR